MNEQTSAFDFQAEVGLTKHPGSLAATEEMAELCAIGANTLVLDVGCGVGVTPCQLAKIYGCRVVGVDIRQRMIDRCNERAEREGLLDLVQFRVADVLQLPFDDDSFDVVIGESVIAMVGDQQAAVNECARVVRPGGIVGLNESTWIKTPPTPEMEAWVSQDLSDHARLLSLEGWAALLEGAGLTEIQTRIRTINLAREVVGVVKRQGLRDYLRVLRRSLALYRRDRASRQLPKQAGSMPKGLVEHFGYGIYVGRKRQQ